MHRTFNAAVALAFILLLPGCAVVAVTATAAGLAVDATVGAVKLTGKAVGAAVDVMTPSADK
ncbi:MAG: hypothetical protein V4787_01590 [Pseudomonadota bacterium]